MEKQLKKENNSYWEKQLIINYNLKLNSVSSGIFFVGDLMRFYGNFS